MMGRGGGGVQLRFTALPDTLNPSQSIIRRVVYLRPSERQAGVDWDSVGLRLSQASFTLPADERLRPAAITAPDASVCPTACKSLGVDVTCKESGGGGNDEGGVCRTQ